MEGSWDDDNFEPQVQPKLLIGNKWEGEDEEDDIKESWEDEDEEKPEEKKEELVAVQVKKKKTLADKIAEKEKQKLLEMEKKKKEAEEEEEDEISPEEKIRLEKESDLNLALETTFGGSNSSSLDSMAPKTKEEFDEFGEAFLRKVRPLSASSEFTGFAENLIRNLCANLTSMDLKKIKTTIDNLVLEKQKIEKGDKAKKNKGKGKAKLKMDNENQYSAYVDDYEYEDFM